ncbi:hypothetical protein BABINDRAFT_126345 [Babjeviella inositovora NRRL Y-12698]|uniref:Uncharacterized protein n=1 Tax=Babjeviella inositovora NRRL Y-12698 TaxID=984486 RepID=A0A1E3QSN4_9ASCO|nr:uncharacterized protein BABINDRAFT_126345 [Babjeviella inositovora NRRL Y-12698]ODQ80723.1 hypothetical protein BABINDRAFT_126345 [Babjeviella inositovora NRRL Y-12698]
MCIKVGILAQASVRRGRCIIRLNTDPTPTLMFLRVLRKGEIKFIIHFCQGNMISLLRFSTSYTLWKSLPLHRKDIRKSVVDDF